MPKRTSGEGTIYQRPDGLWRAEITLGYDGDGKRKKKVFSSMDLETVQKKVNDFKYKLDRNVAVQKSDYTVYEWAVFWLEKYKLHGLKAKTYDSYEFSLNRHIKDAIGGIKLDRLKADTVQGFYNSLHEKGLGSTTIHIVHTVLSQAYDQAIKNELVYLNPCRATSRPRKEKKQVVAFTRQEQQAFVKGLGGSGYHLLFAFLLNTGLRVGEARALTWEDVDFENRLVIVNKTVSDVKNRDEDPATKMRAVVTSTKTAHGERQVPLNKIACEVCAVQKSRDLNDILVFSSKAGTMIQERNINRSLKALLENLRFQKKFTVHSLRHSFATRLMEKGVNPKVVSALLGHASVQITLDLYSHAMPEMKSKAVGLLDELGNEPITTALPHL